MLVNVDHSSSRGLFKPFSFTKYSSTILSFHLHIPSFFAILDILSGDMFSDFDAPQDSRVTKYSLVTEFLKRSYYQLDT